MLVYKVINSLHFATVIRQVYPKLSTLLGSFLRRDLQTKQIEGLATDGHKKTVSISRQTSSCALSESFP